MWDLGVFSSTLPIGIPRIHLGYIFLSVRLEVLHAKSVKIMYQSSSWLFTSHKVVLSSSPAVAIFVPSGDHRQTRMPDPEFTRTFAWHPFCRRIMWQYNKRRIPTAIIEHFTRITSTFHTMAVPSNEQDASILPQGLNSTWFMLYLWPSNGL